MDFVLFGYSPESVKSIISASNGLKKPSLVEYEKSRKFYEFKTTIDAPEFCLKSRT